MEEITFDEVKIGDKVRVVEDSESYISSHEFTVSYLHKAWRNNKEVTVFGQRDLLARYNIEVSSDKPETDARCTIYRLAKAPTDAASMPIATTVTEPADGKYTTMWVKVGDDMWHGYGNGSWHSLASNASMDRHMITEDAVIVYPNEG